MLDLVGFSSFRLSTIKAIAIDKEEQKPYPAKVTGRCGLILHISRHDPNNL